MPQGMGEHESDRGTLLVIGGANRSRQAGPDLFDRLEVSLARTNDRLVLVQPLQITIGDEFQGIYDGLGQALNATLYLRLVLLDVAGVRFGVGWGDIMRRDPDRAPYEQDGSGLVGSSERSISPRVARRRSRPRLDGRQPSAFDRGRTVRRRGGTRRAASGTGPAASQPVRPGGNPTVEALVDDENMSWAGSIDATAPSWCLPSWTA